MSESPKVINLSYIYLKLSLEIIAINNHSEGTQIAVFTSMENQMSTSQEQEVKQIQTFLSSYNTLSEICFMDCIQDFTNRTISTNENSCVMNCAEKYLKMTQRLTLRLQEQQQLQSESGQK